MITLSIFDHRETEPHLVRPGRPKASWRQRQNRFEKFQEVSRSKDPYIMSTGITDPAKLPILFQDTLNAGAIEDVLALFAPGAGMRTVAGEIISGDDALRAEISGTVAAGGRLTNVQRHTLLGADTALLVTDWTMEIDGPGGERVTATGTTANIARRDADGDWRFTMLNPLGTSPVQL
ncbi:YybH family protein [Catenulispora pinisilvae]|uniref:YybH family protein n=1 Tax=Catenulispora pinisilvae TaxID=2705253 RepID=UPI0018926DDD|nr:nuclear transport factor 2 family protein [Catenulispora pinisilvae]